MHSNTFVPNDDKPKVLNNNLKKNLLIKFLQNFVPVERASCFDVKSPVAGLTDRILNGQISIKNTNKK